MRNVLNQPLRDTNVIDMTKFLLQRLHPLNEGLDFTSVKRGAPDLDPLWSMLDWAPEGRGTDWYPKLDYSHKD